MFIIRRPIKFIIASILLALFVWRSIIAIVDLMAGNENLLLALPLAVIFPTLLISVLLLMPATETKEGLIMRVGTIIHLLLIIGIPPLAIYLALGFPFVFLAVEIFETRLPKTLRNNLTKLVLA